MKLYCEHSESGVSHLVEYILISSILVILMVITFLSLNNVFVYDPLNKLNYYAYEDIGNGISTRMVDLYIIAPTDGNVTTSFDIPDDVAGRGYVVEVFSGTGHKDILRVTNGEITSDISLAGIGASLGVMGRTTSSGLNQISYSSAGFP
jgi:hypothetical protein